jgi:ribonuclease Z
MAYWRIPGERIGAVLLTHYHSDHIGDLGEFNMQTWVAGRPGPLAVYGGPGIERVVAGFTEAYALDTGYRVAHHGSELIPVERSVMVPHTIDAKPAGEAVTVIEDGGLRITAFAVDHAPVEPALAYRFDWKGRSVIVSGDTVATESMVRHARGIDVLAHEAQAQHMVAMLREGAAAHGRPRVEKIMSDIPDYHTSPVEVVEMAAKAGVRLALLYHLTPPPRNLLMERILLRGVSSVPHKGVEVEVADDGTLVTLPADSEEFEVSKIK